MRRISIGVRHLGQIAPLRDLCARYAATFTAKRATVIIHTYTDQPKIIAALVEDGWLDDDQLRWLNVSEEPCSPQCQP